VDAGGAGGAGDGTPRGGGARGVRLVATLPRGAAASAAIALVAVIAAATFLEFVAHSQQRVVALFSHGPLLALALVLETTLTFAALAAEESRLARELRIARTGTAALRSLVSRRRTRAPFFARLFSTGLGTAAVLIADGDRTGAVEAIEGISPFMRGGRLDRLRAVVEADLSRAVGSPVALDGAIRALRSLPPTGNVEADRYRVHVFVKAVLERGDDDTAMDLALELASSPDEEQRVGATWLRVWFDLDTEADGRTWPPIGEPQARLAALAARAHGAESLVDKIEARLLAIARPEPRG
jgi:hypothetical protein